MPRYARDDDGDIYRVVVTVTHKTGDSPVTTSSSQNYGPYQTRQAANAQATRHVSRDGWYTYRDRSRITTAKVQRTSVKWEDVSE